jgi:sterol 3beta-glucosyltransferase
VVNKYPQLAHLWALGSVEWELNLRIAILTAGSRGDVQPYVALGLGLQSAGHSVWLASYAQFAEFVSEFGLPFRQVPNRFANLFSSEEWRRWQLTGDRPAGFLLGFRRILRAHQSSFVSLFEDFARAAEGAEAILYPTAGFGGPDIAEHLGVPGYPAHLYPAGATGAFPCFLGPTWLQLGGAYNRWTYRFATRFYARLFGEAIGQFRTRLGLGSRGAFDPFATGTEALYGYSPALMPKPDDWDLHQHVTGYWFVPSASEWQPPSDLTAFLAAGAPPVFVSESSLGGDAGLARRLVSEGPERTGCRLIVQAVGDTLGTAKLATGVMVVDRPSYDWLFPRLAGVVHHGGPGTVATVARAGVPSFTIPAFFDQPFWGRRLHVLGAGVAPCHRRHLTFDRLITGIRGLVNDSDLRTQARRLGERVAHDTGVRGAVEVLEQCLMRGRRRS